MACMQLLDRRLFEPEPRATFPGRRARVREVSLNFGQIRHYRSPPAGLVMIARMVRAKAGVSLRWTVGGDAFL